MILLWPSSTSCIISSQTKSNVEHVQLEDLLDALLTHPSTHTGASNWARATMMKTYISEVASLSSQENGLHYLVAGAPCLWELIGGLLVANVDLKSRREKHAVNKGWQTDTDVDSLSTDDRSWELLQAQQLHTSLRSILPRQLCIFWRQRQSHIHTIISLRHRLRVLRTHASRFRQITKLDRQLLCIHPYTLHSVWSCESHRWRRRRHRPSPHAGQSPYPEIQRRIQPSSSPHAMGWQRTPSPLLHQIGQTN